MRFSTDASSLLAGLQTTKRALATQTTIPLLECVALRQVGDDLRLRATDQQVWIDVTIPVQSDLDGMSQVAIRPGRVIKTLRALPDDAVVDVFVDDDLQVTLRTEKGEYSLHGYDAEDYLEPPEVGHTPTEITGSDWTVPDALDKTAFAVTDDSLRPAMDGVYFDAGAGAVVATDGHRLCKLYPAMQTIPASFILPSAAAGLVQSTMEDPTVAVSEDEGAILVEDGPIHITARAIDETYPSYQSVIPDENDKRLTIGREDMLNAVKRVGLYSSSMTNQIRLDIESDQVTISAEDVERSSEAEEVVPCEFDSDNMEIGFNSDYLAEVLGNVSCDEVVFRLDSPNRAAIVEPLGDDTDDIRMLVMPVMLNSYA